MSNFFKGPVTFVFAALAMTPWGALADPVLQPPACIALVEAEKVPYVDAYHRAYHDEGMGDLRRRMDAVIAAFAGKSSERELTKNEREFLDAFFKGLPVDLDQIGGIVAKIASGTLPMIFEEKSRLEKDMLTRFSAQESPRRIIVTTNAFALTSKQATGFRFELGPDPEKNIESVRRAIDGKIARIASREILGEDQYKHLRNTDDYLRRKTGVPEYCIQVASKARVSTASSKPDSGKPDSGLDAGVAPAGWDGGSKKADAR